jgi:hypothetical protein
MTEIKLNYKRKKRAKNMLLKNDVYIQCSEYVVPIMGFL